MGDLIGNKIADKVTSVSKKSDTYAYISPEERQQIID